MIDLHVHILPGLDDGPATVDAAVEMARTAVRAGTRAVATTSHVDVGIGLQPHDLAAARAALAERLAADDVPLELLAGGEIAPARLPDLDDDALRALALGGGSCVLFECPFVPVGATLEPMVADLRRRGFAVLLAHPERSPTFQGDLVRLERLVELGAWAQVTAGALAGQFGGVPQRAGMKMLEAGLVHVLASDSHDAVRRGPDPRVAEPALADRYGDVEDQLRWMTDGAPAAIVAGEPLPDRPPLPRPRRLWARLRA